MSTIYTAYVFTYRYIKGLLCFYMHIHIYAKQTNIWRCISCKKDTEVS